MKRNQHAREAMLLLYIARGNRDIIEEAKAHRLPRFGMMPRRSDRTEGMVHLPAHDRIDSGQCPADRQIGSGQ